MLTYASLKERYGPGEIVTPKNKIYLASRLSIVESPTDAPLVASQLAYGHDKISGNLLKFNFILTTSGANFNKQFFVEDEIKIPEIYQTPLGEPINQDHVQTFEAIVGEIFESTWVDATSERPSGIRCRGVIFADDYPKVANKVRIGAGRWAAVSMEAIPRPLEKIGGYLVIHNPQFTGAGLVRIPACPYAKIDEIEGNNVNRYRSEDQGLSQVASLREAVNILFG